MVVCIHTCRIRETWYLRVSISAGTFAFRSCTRTRGGPSRTPSCRLRTQSGRRGNWAGAVRLHVGRNEVEEGSWEGSSRGALRPQHFAQSYSAWWETGLVISKVIPLSPSQYLRFSDVRGQSLRESMLPGSREVEGAHGNGEIGESSWTVLWTRPWSLSTLHRVIVRGG